VFSRKGRRPFLRDEERGQLHAYITGILKNHDSPLIEINSVRDHIIFRPAGASVWFREKSFEVSPCLCGSIWLHVLKPAFGLGQWV
jgi:hypothetical protein